MLIFTPPFLSILVFNMLFYDHHILFEISITVSCLLPHFSAFLFVVVCTALFVPLIAPQ